MARVLITGSRSWRCLPLAARIIERLIAKHGKENLTLVHGDCPTGVDFAFHLAAVDAGLIMQIERWPADWDNVDIPGAVVRRNKTGKLYNANAGPLRNKAMVNAGADLCLAVHRDIRFSKGSKGCARLALAAGIPTYLIDSEDGEPKRLEEVP